MDTPRDMEETASSTPAEMAKPPADLAALSEYNVLKTLGEGGFATVMLVEHKFTGYQVALKVFKKPENPDKLNKIYREAVIMKMLDHPNIVKMFNVIESENYVYLGMEYCNGGDLFDFTLKDGEETAKIIFRQIASAIQHCHEHNIVHRDIKLENILVVGDNTFKVTDFGLADTFSPGTFLTHFCGTLEYMAPEMVSRKPYGPEVDIWSLGVLLYNLLSPCAPFERNTREETIEAVKKGQYSPPAASEDCKDLIRQMLTVDPTQRATMQDIINSRWLREDSPEPSAEELSSDFSLQSIIETDLLSKDSSEDSMEQTSSTSTSSISCVSSDSVPSPDLPEQSMEEKSSTSISSDSSSQKIVQTSVLSPDSCEQSMEEKSSTPPPKRRPRPVRWWRAVKKYLGQCCCSCFSDPETCDFTSATFLDNNPQFWRQ